MIVESLLQTIDSISSVVTLILGIAAVLSTVVPPIRNKIKSIFRPYDASMEQIKEADIAILRNAITHIYYKHLDNKTLPAYDKENVIDMYEVYKSLGGNTYIEDIVNEMRQWKTEI